MNYEEVVNEVRTWPRKYQESLVLNLRTLWENEDSPNVTKPIGNDHSSNPHNLLWGFLASGKELNDERIQKIIEEARLQKAELLQRDF